MEDETDLLRMELAHQEEVVRDLEAEDQAEADAIIARHRAAEARQARLANRNCELEKQITIEPVSLRTSGGTGTLYGFASVVDAIKRIDTKTLSLAFHGALIATLFMFFWKSFKSVRLAAFYSVVSFILIIMTLSMFVGLDYITFIAQQ